MANPDEQTVIRDVALSNYKELYEQVWPGIDLDLWETMTEEEINIAYNQAGLAIAAFERTQLFGQFNSKYDVYLAQCMDAGGTTTDCALGVGKVAKKVGKKFFTKEEWYGMQLFMGENDNDGVLKKGEGAMCVACHIADWTGVSDYAPLSVQSPTWAPTGMVPPVFSDFTYDNLGLPKNSEYPLDPNAPIDLGLGSVLGDEDENGKFKVMSLRNIGLTAPYGHNGYFDTLKDIVHFYNTRDVPQSLPQGLDWPAPEYPDTVNFDELSNLGLSDADEDALVEFMKTLSDGWTP